MIDILLWDLATVGGWVVVGLAALGLLVLISAACMGGWKR